MPKKEITDIMAYFKGYCFFCDRPMVESGAILLKKDWERLYDIFEDCPNIYNDTIGNKKICKTCTGELWAIIQPDRYYKL